MNLQNALRHTLVLVTSVAIFVLPHHTHSTTVAWQQTNGPLGGVGSKLITINDEAVASLYSGGIYRYTAEPSDASQPGTSAEARTRLISGVDTHAH